MRNLALYIFFIMAFSAIHIQLFGQQSLYSIEQYIDTEARLKAILSPLSEPEDSIIGLVYFSPNTCPRCESLLHFFLTHKTNLKLDKKLIGVLNYPKEQAGKRYFQSNNWKLDGNVIDSKDIFSSIFHYTSGKLRVPFLMLIDVQKGKMLKSTPLLGIECDEQFVLDFYDTSDLPSISQSRAKPIYKQPGISPFIRNRMFTEQGHLTYLDKSNGSSYSEIYDLNVSNEHIAFIDDLFTDIYVYNSKGKLFNQLEITEGEYNIFRSPTVSDELFNIIKPALKCIYLKLLSVDSTSISISASLPQTHFDTTDFSLSYYNQPVIIKKNTSSNNVEQVHPIERLPRDFEEEGYILKHSKMQMEENTIFVPLVRGWPTVGTGGTPPDDISRNPFSNQFYDNAHIGVLYDKEGTYLGTIGSLPNICKDIKSGYFISNFLFTIKGDKIILADKYLGSIYMFTSNSPQTTIDSMNLFESELELNKEKLKAVAREYESLLVEGGDNINLKTYYTEHLKPAANMELLNLKLVTPDLLACVYQEKNSSFVTANVININTKKVISSQDYLTYRDGIGTATAFKLDYLPSSNKIELHMAFDQSEEIILETNYIHLMR
ncbi:MAG: hypothetical protein MI974_04345 [Chitinophagales bacterium]|nr:hypothetical protein [Chitinophagales bacterium]